MWITVATGAVLALVLVAAYAMDRRARRGGHRPHVRIRGWFEREAQVTAARSMEQYMLDTKDLGSGYSADTFRADDDAPRAD